MSNLIIESIRTVDARYSLQPGEGTDAVHSDPEYCMAVTRLLTNKTTSGSGIALSLGEGNRLICEAIDMLARPLVGLEIEDVMAEFGVVSRSLADHPSLRWLGPHKGVVHLALASITNACFDLWAKSRGVPLWKLLLDLSPEELIRTLDLSYVEDELTREEALTLVEGNAMGKNDRHQILTRGYPGYDTSI